MTITLEHAAGTVRIRELGNDRRQLTVDVAPGEYVACRQWETSYPVSLIEDMLRVKGPGWLCDEIRRDEDPAYVQRSFLTHLFAYIDPSEFAGARLLDFGCGSGASTIVLARALPHTTIVGVELSDELLSVARRRVAHSGARNVTLHQSPSGTELPRAIGTFGFVVLIGVYEHLLPEERARLLPQIWSLVRAGGVLVLDQVPNRLFPIELHTTHLPLINYLPAPLAYRLARRFCARVKPHESWQDLLRRGIRGTSVAEIRRRLPSHGGRAVVLEPTRAAGVRDRIDLWYLTTAPDRRRRLKAAARAAIKAVQRTTSIELTPDVTLAIRKDALQAGG